MKISCPFCFDHIDVADEVALSDISCPSCDSTFDLVAAENVDATIVDNENLPSETKRFRTIGRFELIEEVGSGAFGSVWRGNDPTLDRKVAVKVPRKGQLTPFESELFFREARAAAQLKHANIVPVHEIGKEDETIYIVSEFIDGQSLADRLLAGRLAMRESAMLCAKVALALEHAHSKGVVHRDLKPGNIMLDSVAEPFVMDFGLAKRDAGEITMTLEGRILGTPAYMSPEQAKGEGHHVDGRTDVYSLGVILFELLTGEIPFRGNQRMLLHQVINDEATSPRKLNNSIPKDLETICLKCLEKQPGRRYDSAQLLADDLGRFLSGKPISARPLGKAERTWRWCQRKPALASAIALTALLIVGVAAAGPVVAYQQSQIAEKNRNIALKEREYSAQQTKVAEQNEAIAKREKENADQQREIAAQQTQFAKEQEKLTKLAQQETKKKEEALNNLKRERSTQLVNEAIRAKESGRPHDAMILLDKAISSSDYDQEILRLNINRFRMLWQQYPISGFWNNARVISWTKDEKFMAIGDASGGVQIWDGSGKFMIEYYKPHNSLILGLAFDESGKSIVSTDADGTLRVIDIEKSMIVGGFNFNQTKFNDLRFVDGLLTGHSPATDEFLFWEVANSNQQPKVSKIQELNHSLKRSIVAIRVADKIRFLKFDKSESGLPDIPVDGELLNAQFSINGDLLAVAVQKDSKFHIKLFDVDTGELLQAIPDVASKISLMRIASDSKRIAFDQEDESNSVVVFNLESKMVEATQKVDMEIAGMEFSQLNRLLAIVVGEATSPELHVLNVETNSAKVIQASINKSFAKIEAGPEESFFVTTIGVNSNLIHRWKFELDSKDSNVKFKSPIEDLYLMDDEVVLARVDNKAYQLVSKANSAKLVDAEFKTNTQEHVESYKVQVPQAFQVLNLDGVPLIQTQVVTQSRAMTIAKTTVQMLVDGKATQQKAPNQNLNSQFVKLGDFDQIAVHGPSQTVFIKELDEEAVVGKHVYRFWDARSLQPMSEKLITDREIESATFSHDGRFILLHYNVDLSQETTDPATDTPVSSIESKVAKVYDFQILDIKQGKMVTGVVRGESAIISRSVELMAVVSGNDVKVIEVNSPANYKFQLERAMASALNSRRVDEFGELVASGNETVEFEIERARAQVDTVPEDLRKKWHIASANWAMGRAQSHAEMFEVAELHAIGWRNSAVDDPNPSALLGVIYGVRGDFDKALTSSERAVKLNAEPIYAWTNLATLKLSTGDHSGYRSVCSKIWEKFGSNENPNVVDEAIWIQTLWADENFDYSELLSVAERNYQKFPKARRFANTLIAILLRMNKPDRAKEVVSNLGSELPAHEMPVRSMLAKSSVDFANQYTNFERFGNWIDGLQVTIIGDTSAERSQD